jgi:hypothetical protein
MNSPETRVLPTSSNLPMFLGPVHPLASPETDVLVWGTALDSADC